MRNGMAWPQVTRHQSQCITLYRVLEWVCGAFNNFPAELVRNAWMKTGFAWFHHDHVQVEDEDDDLADDDDDDLVLRMDWSGDSEDTDTTEEDTDATEEDMTNTTFD